MHKAINFVGWSLFGGNLVCALGGLFIGDWTMLMTNGIVAAVVYSTLN